ncbi:hypothetical protein Ntsu_79770 [Nocardia sp. IFM 10818]
MRPPTSSQPPTGATPPTDTNPLLAYPEPAAVHRVSGLIDRLGMPGTVDLHDLVYETAVKFAARYNAAGPEAQARLLVAILGEKQTTTALRRLSSTRL